MKTSFIILICLSAYFLGSIPFALVISKFKKIDLRTIGSGNIGATNVYRALGFKYAALVFTLDALKGFIPTLLSRFFFPDLALVHIIIGTITIVGHSLTIFARFKGGKGAATGLGVLMALNPPAFAFIAGIAAIIIWLTRYVSLATITCSLLAPITLYVFKSPIEYIIFTTIIALFIVYRHKANIYRLLRGKENKV